MAINIINHWTGTIIKTVESDTLQHANLWGADLQHADLWGADLQGAKLQGAKLQYANLRGADLRNAKLQYANLRGADLRNAKLQYANLRGADLRNAKLQYANLRGADLQHADLWGADLQGAKLRGADLTNANLEGATLPGFTDKVPETLAEAATQTRDWLAGGHWMAGAWIKTPTGAYAGDCLACLHGAARYIGGPILGGALSDRLTELGYTVAWNDEKGRTVEEVCAALDRVASEPVAEAERRELAEALG